MSNSRRLGRAVLRLLQHESALSDPVVRARLDNLLLVARAMDYAARLREFGSGLTPALGIEFATHAGIGLADLRLRVLPVLQAADVVAFRYDGADLVQLEEYVGVSAPVLDQVVAVLESLAPPPTDWAILHSVEIASWTPLTTSNHLEQLTRRGFDDEDADTALKVCLAARITTNVPSTELGEPVVYSPYVWGSEAVPVASFLNSLPSDERTVLVSVCEQATTRPGLAISTVGADRRILAGARKVGLLQAATVKSTGQVSQTYLFSPLIEREDDTLRTTETLHERKLFVAHIMFGHERAAAGRGRIRSPVVLVNALLQRGEVGPATNIGTDYHLLEAAGIVRVEPVGGRSILRMVKSEIVSDGLDLLRRMVGDSSDDFDPMALGDLRPPRTFLTPEADRLALSSDAATNELFGGAILRLREEAARAARHESPF